MKEGRTKVIQEIEIEIEDLQHILDNQTCTVRKLAQKDMVKLLNKKKMVASNEQEKSKKKRAASVKMQKTEDEMDNNEFSNGDERMSSVTHIPKETGVNNSDTESMLIDGKDENKSDGDGKKMDDDESMGSTDAELLKIEEKEKKKRG